MSDTIIGALIALSGVVLTLLSVHVADWIKSSRDRKESQRQRELTLKRDFYVPLVQAFTEGVTLLISIPQAHHSKLSELKLSQESQNALAAKDLIANESVTSAVNAAAKQLAQGIMRLMLIKMDEAKLAVDLEYLGARIGELNSENRLIIDRMRALQDAGTLHPETTEVLDSQFKENDSELRKLLADQKEKLSNRNNILKDLHSQSMKEVAGMTAVASTAVIEIRRDLQIPTDEETMRKSYRESIEYIDEAFPGFLDEVWGKVKENTDG